MRIKKEKMKERICCLEIAILILSSVSFAYLVYMSTNPEQETGLEKIFSGFMDYLTRPMIAKVSAVNVNFCCEKTTYGAWCQNALETSCDAGFRKNPASCDATSFCRAGCCYDSSEGTCSENTPQLVCQQSNGTWADSASCDIPQCNLGCCVLDNQAAFVTLVRCKKLSAFFGLQTDFRTNINSESACIAVAQSQQRGACVFEEDYTRTCKFLTRSECEAAKTKKTSTVTSNFTFYPDSLCSNEELGTNCGPTEKTTCIEGKDEVYFVDSCGNTANIYDSSRAKDKAYWKTIIDKSKSCGAGNSNGNANSPGCGNCDYFSGSFCKKYDKSKDARSPSIGDYMCRDLNCKDTSDGKDYRHGESWCVYDDGTGKGLDPAGSRYWKHVCIAGEELVEPCADARQEVCLQDKITTSNGDFQQAGCVANKWQDCVNQKTKKDCENIDRRDCQWIEGVIGQDSLGSNGTVAVNTQKDSEKKVKDLNAHGVCVPDVPPGLKFWQSGESEGVCSQGSSICEIEYEKGLLSGKKCIKNCECEEASWKSKRQEVCQALGDCSGTSATCADGSCKIKDGVYKYLGKDSKGISGTKLVAALAGIFDFVFNLEVVKAEKVVIDGIIYNKEGYVYEPLDGPRSLPLATNPAETSAPRLSFEEAMKVGGPLGPAGPTGGTTLPSDLSGLFGKATDTFTMKLADGSSWEAVKVVSSDGSTYAKALGRNDVYKLTDGQYQKAGSLTGDSGSAGGKGLMDGVNSLLADGIIGSLFWAVTIGGVVYMAAGLFGADKNTQTALFAGTFAGVFSWNIMNPILTGKGLDLSLWGGNSNALSSLTAGKGIPYGSTYSLVGAIAIGLIVFVMLYKKTSTKIVTFDCKPYEPPTGGSFCELCNQDKLRPCSEYRCKSLGQACEIVNAGTGNEKCVWQNRKDVTSPGIRKWDDVITKGYIYSDYRERPEGGGSEPGRYTVKSLSSSDGCVKAFTPLTFGINTTEPTKCKIDYNTTVTTRGVKVAFESMKYYFGETSMFSYTHSQTLRLPGPSALAAQNISPEINNDGTYTLYVRCSDANGNINEDEFSIRFCVEKGPDTTPARIEGTSIQSGMPVQFGLNETELEVYVNEPADCKWSRQDIDYDLMENSMSCDQNVWDINNNMLYKCFTTLTGLENRKENKFYFKCKDQPYAQNQNDRLKNTESYQFILKGTEPVYITNAGPNGTVNGYSNVVGVDLNVETSNGYNKGDAICYFSQTNTDSGYIKMYNTGTNKHTTRQDLAPGTYTYYFKCVDLGGNTAYNSTQFTVSVDRSAPQIIRVYNEAGSLRIDTDEQSTCYYSDAQNQKCNFALADGKPMLHQNSTDHYTEWKVNTNLFIKCLDSSGNQPLPNECSITVKPYVSRAS